MSEREVREVQERLIALDILKDRADGIPGPKTLAAIRGFQRISGLKPDGIPGPKTREKLFPPVVQRPDEADGEDLPTAPAPARSWPRQKDLRSVFGDPGSARATSGSCALPFPFRIAWNLNQRISKFACHELVAEPMRRIFENSAAHYGEKEFRRLNLDRFGGCYANRLKRGGSTPSTHAFGIAYDVDPEHNQLRWGRDRATLDGSEFEPFWRIVEAEGAVSLGRVRNFDWMHFQFARL